MDPISIAQRLGNGFFLSDLADALTEVGEEVIKTGNPGKVSIVIDITKLTADDVAAAFKSTVRRALPTKSARTSLFYASGNGELTKTDPRAPELPFGIVEPSIAPLPIEPGIAPLAQER